MSSAAWNLGITVPFRIGLILLAMHTAPPAGPAESPRASDAKRIAALIDDGEPAAALRLIEDAADRLSEFDRHALTGRACAAMQRRRQAQAAFEQALRLRPNAPDILFRLGRVQAGDGRDAAAATSFERAFLHGLDSAELHAAWAASLLRLGQTLGRLRTVRLRLDYESGEIVNDSLVVVRRLSKDADRYVVTGRGSSVFHAARAVRDQPERGDWRLLLADAWRAARLYRPAAIAYARAERALPPDSRAACLERWADCLLALHDYDAYLDRLREWMALPGGLSAERLSEAYARVAERMGQIGDTPRQLRCLTFALELRPKSVAVRVRLADALQDAGRLEDAVRHYRSVLAQSPHHPRAAEFQRRVEHFEAATAESNR